MSEPQSKIDPLAFWAGTITLVVGFGSVLLYTLTRTSFNCIKEKILKLSSYTGYELISEVSGILKSINDAEQYLTKDQILELTELINKQASYGLLSYQIGQFSQLEWYDEMRNTPETLRHCLCNCNQYLAQDQINELEQKISKCNGKPLSSKPPPPKYMTEEDVLKLLQRK